MNQEESEMYEDLIAFQEEDKKNKEKPEAPDHLEKEMSKKQVASVSDKGVYKGRRDAGTKGSPHGHENGWNKGSTYPTSDSPEHQAKFKEEKEKVELEQELAGMDDELINPEKEQEPDWANETGLDKFRELSDSSGVAHIDHETEFPGDFDEYLKGLNGKPRYDIFGDLIDPAEEERERLEAKERCEAEQIAKEEREKKEGKDAKEFHADRGNMGRRGKGRMYKG